MSSAYRWVRQLGSALAFFTVASAHAQTCVAGIATTKPTSRYAVSGVTVTDQHTGLMWDQCAWGQSGVNCSVDNPAAVFTWQQALALPVTANNAAHRGFGDWRLPNIKELQSLVETCRSNPSVNDAVFPNASGSRFWSASPNTNSLSQAWLVDYYSGSTDYKDRVDLYSVRLVRAGK